MDRYCRRLIEVDFPVLRVSEASRQEKDSRLAHVPRIHIYPAHRPLAACRSTLLALLLPDPVDLAANHDSFKHVPAPDVIDQYFKATHRTLERWRDRIGRNIGQSSSSLLIASQKNPDLVNDPAFLRAVLLAFIADYSAWDNSLEAAYVEAGRELITASNKILAPDVGDRPLVVDPFAGGGAIPLEALRLGCDAFASDLNAVAVMVQKTVVEFLPKYGQALPEALEEWVAWVKPRAVERLNRFYPLGLDGGTPIAYLWARVVLSEAPDRDDVPVEVPLLRSMWLSRNPRRRRALRWVRDSKGVVATETAEVAYADGSVRLVRRPILEIFEPDGGSVVESGTSSRNAATCPVTGFTTPARSVERQLVLRSGGATDARLYCVVSDPPAGGGNRDFRLPEPDDYKAGSLATDWLGAMREEHAGDLLALVPDEHLPIMSGVFNAPIYGHDEWGKLFTSRQLVSLLTYSDLVREYVAGLKDDDPAFGRAVAAALGLIIDRLADLNASLCGWQLNTANTAHVFTRWALPMMVDFGEVNPLAGAGGSPESAVRRAAACMRDLVVALDSSAEVRSCSATTLPLPDDAAEAIVTDPPYYNAIPYADLMDFFYVWLRRSVGEEFPDLFDSQLNPKDAEICEMAGWDPARYAHKDKAFFETQMRIAMIEARRVLKPSGAAVCVFAHKSTAGWEAMLQALIDAGWMITASWPVDTEMGSRLRAQNSAVLASSVHIVMRPRENEDGSITDDVGDWRDVLAELPRRIHEWMPRLAEEGVVGADAIFACLGPALEIFSRYSEVEKASGDAVLLAEYLSEVWAAVSREALSMIFQGADASGFEEDARLTAMWLWTIHTGANGDTREDEETKSLRGYALEYDAARKIAQGLGAHLENLSTLVEVKGDTATLLSAGARMRYLFGGATAEVPRGRRGRGHEQLTLDPVQGLEKLEQGAGGVSALIAGPGATDLDRLHQAMIFFGAGRGEALRRFLVEDGIGRDARFWRLAQALSSLYPAGTDEKRWVDGVLGRKKGLGL